MNSGFVHRKTERTTHGEAAPIRLSMLKWTLICAVLAIVFGVLGFGGVAAGFAAIAKILFAIFIIGVIVTLILGATVFKAVT